jgi:alpha-glucosidase
VPSDHLQRAVDVQLNDANSILNYYKAMLKFRRAHPALAKGTIKMLDMPEGVLGFIREEGDERLLCVYNMRAVAADMQLPGGLDPQPVDSPVKSVPAVSGSLSLAPFGAYIGAV